MIFECNWLDGSAANIMQKRGGFAWWYLDLVTSEGDALVFIWSFGLPFLPYGARVEPAARPAVSLALYRHDRPALYLLQELSADRATFVDGRGRACWRFADSVITVCQRGDEVALSADLALAIPASRSRLVGRIRARGAAWSRRGSTPPAGAHTWSPIFAAAHGEADLHHQGECFALSGRAYLDGNASALPLDALGIRDWRWGRVALGTRDLVYYALRPEEGDGSVELAAVVENGRVRSLENARFEWLAPARSMMGVPHDRGLRLIGAGIDVTVRSRAIVDDAPFYLRALTSGRCARTGASGHGVAEVVLPGRLGIGWQQPFVRMRSHKLGGANSMWLPLFSGPRRGRVRRLVAQLLPGAERA
jgi:carotenoid 1,2-hydratase